MQLRVVSYNIRHGHDVGLDMSVLVKDLMQVHPDVIGLQEVDVGTSRVQGRDTLSELAAHLKKAGFADNVHYAFCRAIDFAGGQYGTAILSRYPILSFKVISLPTPAHVEVRAIGHAILDVDGERVDFFNTHLTYESAELRKPQFDFLAALTAQFPGWILTGDFNTADLSCFDAFPAASLANPGKYVTFPESGEGIDNVVCDASRRITDTGILQNFHSDHVLLWAEIER